MDLVVAIGADHEGLPAPFHHDFGPFGLTWPPGFVEVGESADVVCLYVGALLAPLAPACPEPTDQLFAFAAVGGRGWQAVGEDRLPLPCEGYPSEPRGERLPVACAFHAGLHASA